MLLCLRCYIRKAQAPSCQIWSERPRTQSLGLLVNPFGTGIQVSINPIIHSLWCCKQTTARNYQIPQYFQSDMANEDAGITAIWTLPFICNMQKLILASVVAVSAKRVKQGRVKRVHDFSCFLKKLHKLKYPTTFTVCLLFHCTSVRFLIIVRQWVSLLWPVDPALSNEKYLA